MARYLGIYDIKIIICICHFILLSCYDTLYISTAQRSNGGNICIRLSKQFKAEESMMQELKRLSFM